ncbi:MAG TPA: bifunctional acetate--CoA ligase family protein/GNAT family N-acetyltransferase [Azospirillaceae bacterium]|nr:bifunctional acetate--CoA ligase family protein/GNAT family N-acetyltransferase [Azospirillaceae bacterium]
MTVRNLDHVLKPASIALIGASRKPRSIGQVVARNLFTAGFDGPIMPVNPHERSIEGVLTYPDIASLPVTPDLAVIATPPHTVPALIDELGRRGTKAAVVITAGFGEGGAAAHVQGKELEQRLLDAAKPHLLRVVGPNCLGVVVPGRGINASFCHVAPKPGDIAFLAQSGAVLTSVVDWAAARGIGFSHLVSLGDMADVDFGDLLDYLAQEAGVRAILLYVEAIKHARKFMSAARTAARAKPVIVIKAGRSEEAARAAASHTGALAGSDAVYDAAFRRAGMLRVDDLDELFDAVETLASGVQIRGDRLAILTNGGGIGVLATDTLVEQGGRLAQLDPATIETLDTALPPTWSHGNPVDIIGDAPGKRYADALKALMADPNADAVLALNCPTAVADPTDAARAVVEAFEAVPRSQRKPLLTSWLGEHAAAEARRHFARHHVPTHETPNKAVRAFMHLVHYRRNQELLMETPPSVSGEFETDMAAVRAVLQPALDEGRAWLSEDEAKIVLKAYGVPVVETVRATGIEAAAEAAARIGGAVALKILSPDITHKSDVGGVALHLMGADAVRTEAAAMLERVRAIKPDARITGFTVQEMAQKPDAHELIVGMVEDILFGPVLLFGQGGTAVEVLQDRALGLPPLNMNLARSMIGETRVSRLLMGYRSRPPARIDDIACTLIRISQLVSDFPEIAELDINPLFADHEGVLALDARIRVARPQLPGSARLAIRPYPKRLEKPIRLQDGTDLFLRPIRPEDEPLIHDMFARLTPEDIRLRFFAPMKRLSHPAAARLTQIDYDREMALVAVKRGGGRDGADEILGVVRITADPDNTKAEYAVLVRSDMKGRGLGYLLMREILDYARNRGIGTVFGQVLRENVNMLRMAGELGFHRHDDPQDPGLVEVEIDLARMPAWTAAQ